MKKITYYLLIIIISTNSLIAQCDGRYQTEIFNSVSVTTVNYSDIYNDNFHSMDIYTPEGDIEVNRPLILYLHGGSYYGGNKSMTDCVDFCETMAKKGYVTASLNYRLSNIISFLTSNVTQYETVLKSVADVKSAIRYFRKDFDNGNNYGIDPNTIFVGGYSAGAVTAIHLAYIDEINDLPTSPINVQNIVNDIAGVYGLEGDAGNYGYPSNVSGVISIAGGINNVDWIDEFDEPLVSIQGTSDLTINYNCGPAMNNPLVLTLCGSGEMHPQADMVGVINDKLIFTGENHSWPAYGNNSAKFVQAINFITDFLFPLLPCNNLTYFNDNQNTAQKNILKITDLFGKETNLTYNKHLFFLYSDGTVERKIIFE
tara:strand:+ start:2406 stop:3518 length:1113 start_codon:yes stop_codon:yes gene_type:complete